MHYGNKASHRVSVMLQAMFCGKTFCPDIHVDVILTCISYLTINTEQKHPLIETESPNNSGDNALCQTLYIVWKWSEEHYCKFNVLPGFLISQILIRSSISNMCWAKQIRSMKVPPYDALQLKSWC